MDPHTISTTGSGLPQPGSDLGQLPPIHTPQSFHAPDAVPAHFVSPSLAAPSPAAIPIAPVAAVTPAMSQAPVPITPAAQQNSAMVEFQAKQAQAIAPAEDVDTAFDEEWVAKAKEVVARTHADPYVQSQTLARLKAQYIKIRYNKDVKVSEE